MNNHKNKNKGCVSGILGTLLVFAGVAAFAVLNSLLGRLFTSLRYGDEAVCTIFTFSMTAIGIAFFLYEIIFIMWQIKLTVTASGDQENAQRMSKAFKIVLPVCIALSLLVAVFSANTYTELKEDSISKVCFVKTEEYRWDETRNDVSRYVFSCDENASLTFNIIMKDGEVISLVGGVNSLTDSFKEKYDTSNANLLAYAADLTEKFGSSGYLIDKKLEGAEHMEKYKDNNPSAWIYIEKIIENAK